MYNEKDLELKGFDLGEQGGGMQLIIAAKTISPTEFYVATVGNALPKIQNSPKQDLPSDEIMTDEEIKMATLAGTVAMISFWYKKELSFIYSFFSTLVRYKLSFIEDELNAEEYITWEGIINVAKFMGLC